MECCPKAVIGALASPMGAPLLCLGGIKNVGVQDWAAGHLVDWKMLVLPPLLSTGHMAMNADLLVPGNSIFYLRGARGECVTATVVGLSSLPVCVAINYEHSRHTQYYRDCFVERLTFPIVRADSPASDRGPSPAPTSDIGSAAPAADAQECAECAETLHISTHEQRHFHDSTHSTITVFYGDPCHRVLA